MHLRLTLPNGITGPEITALLLAINHLSFDTQHSFEPQSSFFLQSF